MFSIKDYLAGHTGSQSAVRVSTNNQKECGFISLGKSSCDSMLFLDTGQLCNSAISTDAMGPSV